MQWLTPVFIVALLAATAAELWLSQRQLAEVERNRAQVPGPFAAAITLAEHTKAADYTIAKLRVGRLSTVIDAALTLVLTVAGGIAAVDALWRHTSLSEPWLGLLVIASIAVIIQLVNLPMSLWRTFRLEARFGFNRTTP